MNLLKHQREPIKFNKLTVLARTFLKRKINRIKNSKRLNIKICL
jgi:hypothetical protein